MGGPELRPRDQVELLPSDAFGAIVIGASGTGKSSLVGELQEQGMVFVEQTATTRPMRPVEAAKPPCDHDFFTAEEFKKWENNEWFITTELIYDFSYGVPLLEQPAPGIIPTIVLKPDLVEPVLARYPNMIVCQIEATEPTVLMRMRDRRQTPADIRKRIRLHALETAKGRRLADYIIKNEGTLAESLEHLAKCLCQAETTYLSLHPPQKVQPTDATIEPTYDATESFA